jgi:hypothetical protein
MTGFIGMLVACQNCSNYSVSVMSKLLLYVNSGLLRLSIEQQTEDDLDTEYTKNKNYEKCRHGKLNKETKAEKSRTAPIQDCRWSKEDLTPQNGRKEPKKQL